VNSAPCSSVHSRDLPTTISDQILKLVCIDQCIFFRRKADGLLEAREVRRFPPSASCRMGFRPNGRAVMVSTRWVLTRGTEKPTDIWGFLKKTIKSWPPELSGTSNNPAILENPGLYFKSGKSSAKSWDVLTLGNFLMRRYSNIASASWEFSNFPNTFVSFEMLSSPQSASKRLRRSSEEATT
jgi:hypothetical protein